MFCVWSFTYNADDEYVVSEHSSYSVAVICQMFAAVCAGHSALYQQLGFLHPAELSATILRTHLALRSQKCKR